MNGEFATGVAGADVDVEFVDGIGFRPGVEAHALLVAQLVGIIVGHDDAAVDHF